jgi:hypothetical protein
VNPTTTPALNSTWQQIAPNGAAWGVNQTFAPNEVVSLTIGGTYFDVASSSLPADLAGATIWVQVDSVDYASDFGQLLEADETNNLFGPLVP